jgi:glycogen(starch) synthase
LRVLICADSFLPTIGGVESVTGVVAGGLVLLGHEVIVATRSQVIPSPWFEVVGNPTPMTLRRLAKSVDIVWHSQFALTFSWPLLRTGIPTLVTHHTWPAGNWRSHAKRMVLARSHQTAVSRALASAYPGAAVIPNPYNDCVFRAGDSSRNAGDLVLIGRLIKLKGADHAIRSLKILAQRGHHCRLSIIGEGPERERLGALARSIGVADQVRFHGPQRPVEVARLLRRHSILLIPSRRLPSSEPFGVVALEALACGCVPIGTRYGGLPEAVGDCGLLCDDDPGSLADAAETLLTSPDMRQDCLRRAPSHLEQHSALTVSRAYEAALEGAV